MHRWTLGSLRALPVVGLLAVGLAVSPAVPAAAQSSGTWTKTGSMTTPRDGQSATVLPNGQVLVFGTTGTTSLSAELYNPATGKWTATGSPSCCVGSTVTPLQNGQVLVAGGEALVNGSYVAQSSAELFNPATGTWTATGSMTTARENQAAALLQNGQVLVAGGCDGAGCPLLSSAELYNPATGTWAPTGSMNIAHEGTATLLQNGQVLVAGAATAGSPAELYHPGTGTWTTTGSFNLGCAQLAELLPNGQVLVVCGTGAETYDPASGTWTNDGAAAPPAQRFWSTALLPTGKVLLSGGVNGTYPAKVNETASAVLFDPVTGTTTVTGSMTIPREGHTLTPLPNGQVLAAGGQTENKVGKFSETASAELYTP